MTSIGIINSITLVLHISLFNLLTNGNHRIKNAIINIITNTTNAAVLVLVSDWKLSFTYLTSNYKKFLNESYINLNYMIYISTNKFESNKLIIFYYFFVAFIYKFKFSLNVS
jgi:hypothetical protein